MESSFARQGMPTATALATHPGQAQQATPAEESPCIFAENVPVRVRPAGRDQFTADLAIRVRPDNVAHPRSLLFEITDDSDLFFYHSLVLGEGDFHTLKSEQRLLVDFQSFPAQVVELLRRCKDAGETQARAATDGVRMFAAIDCSAGGDSLFSVIESNHFREFTHIALRLRQGTDEAVKQHLACKLRSFRGESCELSERLRSSDDALVSARRQVDELTTQARIVSEERTHLERTLTATHQRELAEVRQEHALAVSDSQRTASEERLRIEGQLRGAAEDALARAEKAEREVEELRRQLQAQGSAAKSSSERLALVESQLRASAQDAQELREQLRQLELLKFKHEKQIGELEVQRSALQDQLTTKGQLVANHAASADQGASQRRSLEESLAACRQEVRSLEEKFGQAVQEIGKGNKIIQEMRTASKQTKSKLKLKTSSLEQQEKVAQELDRAGELSKREVAEKQRELLVAREREDKLKQEVEEHKHRLSEAHQVLKSNEDVIEWLNRQVTERDIKALPAATLLPEAHARSTPLGDLLKSLDTSAPRLKSSGLAGLGPGAGSLGGTSSLRYGQSLGFGASLASGSTLGAAELLAGTGCPLAGGRRHHFEAQAPLALAGGGFLPGGNMGQAGGSSVLGVSGGQDFLRGPVAYRSPGAGASPTPITVQ